MDRKIVHVQTIVQTVFGELDNDGNVIKRPPISLDVPKLDEDLFGELYRTLVKVRADLATEPVKDQPTA